MQTAHLFSLLLLASVLAACSGQQENPQASQHSHSGHSDPADHSGHGEHEDHAGHGEHAGMEPGEPSGYSVYHASGVWLNRDGEEMRLSDLRGKVQIVTMVYTWCEYACPRILADMKRIEMSLSAEERGESNFVIVSIDPERDTPGRLTDFAEQNNLDAGNWTLLNGDSGDILELAALLGVKYQRISDSDFSHSNMIIVLDQDGEIAHRRVRIGESPGQTVQVIRDLIAS